MYFSIVILVLTKALCTEICDALNVTVTPGPLASAPAGDNVTLSCLVSQRKRSSSFLVLRWFFTPPPSSAHPTLSPPLLSPPSPPPPPPPPPRPPSAAPPPPPPSHPRPSELLIVKMGMKKMKFYGNYTRHFPVQPKFRLYEDGEGGEVYRLLIANVTPRDQGWYTCRVQEIRKHRNTWKAASNGTGATHLTVHFTVEDSSSEGVWRLFADVYLCAVLICSLGLLSMFLFTVVLTGQHLHNRHRLKASYLLVKCPESSSGETVTSSVSSSPRAHRKETRHASHRKASPMLLQLPEEPPPPHVPAKVPIAAQRPRKPRRLKNLSKRSVPQLRVSETEDSLTYAELELVRPRPAEPPSSAAPPPSSSSGPDDPTGPSTSSSSGGSDTVYAQILFQERQL